MSAPTPPGRRRVAVAYDCLFPWTVGGAERWYRRLADALVSAGCDVTYLTRAQWDPGDEPDIPGVRVVAVSRGGALYDDAGTRRLGPTLSYGAGILRHLARHRGAYDLVHTANFPFWSVLGARAGLAGTGTPLVVDWHEVWGRRFWTEYAGRGPGSIGYAVQRACIAASTHPVVTSPVNARRYVVEGGGRPLVLPGLFPDDNLDGASSELPSQPADPPYVLFVGRHIADKGVDLLPGLAAALARSSADISMVIAGDGPMRAAIEAEASALGMADRLHFTGFVPPDRVADLMAAASCLVLPSRREGYGMVAVEATRTGTPVVVASFDENLAVAHIVNGVNGYVAPPSARGMADAIGLVLAGGEALRASTLDWYRQVAPRSTISRSVEAVLALHSSVVGDGPAPGAFGDEAA